MNRAAVIVLGVGLAASIVWSLRPLFDFLVMLSSCLSGFAC
jgi:hypothetical protein